MRAGKSERYVKAVREIIVDAFNEMQYFPEEVVEWYESILNFCNQTIDDATENPFSSNGIYTNAAEIISLMIWSNHNEEDFESCLLTTRLMDLCKAYDSVSIYEEP